MPTIVTVVGKPAAAPVGGDIATGAGEFVAEFGTRVWLVVFGSAVTVSGVAADADADTDRGDRGDAETDTETDGRGDSGTNVSGGGKGCVW